MNNLTAMSDSSFHSNSFVDRAESIILENVSNEQFGVSELAEVMNTSRSNLLRKIKQQTKLSASQFIRQVRLKKSLEILGQDSMTVSEVSFKVGFGSTSYFIKNRYIICNGPAKVFPNVSLEIFPYLHYRGYKTQKVYQMFQGILWISTW